MIRQLFGIFRQSIGILLMATIIFYYAGNGFGLQEVGFTVLFPILFGISLAIDKASSIFGVQESILFLLFIFFTLISIFYPRIDFGLFNFTITKVIAAFMGAYIGIVFSKKYNLEDYFHLAFIISFFILIFFEYSSGNFNPATFYAPTASRDDFAYNANYYSYFSLFANFSILNLHLKYKRRWTLLGSILIPLLSLAISFTTQSRSGLIFVIIINALFWFWVYNVNSQNQINSIARKIVLLLLAFVFSFQFINFYTGSSIRNRLSSSVVKEDERGYLVERGLEVFIDQPFTGVGLGNFGNYNRRKAISHNTYVEALAEHGLFFGSLIILVFVLPLFKSLKLFLRNRSDPKIKLDLIFFAIFILFNNIYVFYKASYAMMYFFFMLGLLYNHLIINYRIKC